MRELLRKSYVNVVKPRNCIRFHHVTNGRVRDLVLVKFSIDTPEHVQKLLKTRNHKIRQFTPIIRSTILLIRTIMYVS